MKHLRKTLALLLAAMMAFSVFAAAAFGAAAASASRVSKDTSFIALNDPVEAFSRLGTFGVEFAAPDSTAFPEEFITVNKNHIQGLARYGEYTIIDVNSDPDNHPNGWVMVYSSTKLLGYWEMEGAGSHVGGIGIAGDYLIVPADNGKFLYDLSPLKSGEMPTGVPLAVYAHNGIGSGSTALTYVEYQGQPALLCGDYSYNFGIITLPPQQGDSIIRLTTDTSGIEPCEFDEPDNYTEMDWGVNNEALVSDVDGNAWMFILASRLTLPGVVADLIGESGMDYEDAASLYKVEIQGSTAVVTGPHAAKQLESYDSYLFALGSHFRFAASVQVLDADNFAIIDSPSLPGNLFLDAVEAKGIAKTVMNLIRPNALPVNGFVTRQVGSAEPASFANIESRNPLNWLYQVLLWFLRIVKLDVVLGYFGVSL
ncbi:MAG: hypothetical protein LBQ80_02990 [Clostridium sp.]|jgi:hypothetical protein|nr:hypothetical protein [Clostridium sp.]